MADTFPAAIWSMCTNPRCSQGHLISIVRSSLAYQSRSGRYKQQRCHRRSPVRCFRSAVRPWDLGLFRRQGIQKSLYSLDSTGNTQALNSVPGTYLCPRFSPDGKQLAVGLFSGNTGLWIVDTERNTSLRLTNIAGDNKPVWSPDGKHIAFDSAQTGIFWIRSDASSPPERLTRSEHVVFPYSFSPDGKRLAYAEANPQTGLDLWTLPLEGSDSDHPKAGKPEPFLRTSANEADLHSPRMADGWLTPRMNPATPKCMCGRFPDREANGACR